jgi:hypothetical protein
VRWCIWVLHLAAHRFGGEPGSKEKVKRQADGLYVRYLPARLLEVGQRQGSVRRALVHNWVPIMHALGLMLDKVHIAGCATQAVPS